LTAAEIQNNILFKMIVPIFPLPNVVLFPKTLLPLHIFEQKYRAMTREVIAGDGKIAIVLLKEGWEVEHQGKPAIHKIACVGQIETYEELEGGKYDIVLAGLHRVRLVSEIEHSPYRLAEVEVLPELSCDDQHEEVIRRRNHLGGLFTRYTELATSGNHQAAEMVLQLEFEALVNMAATTLNLPVEERQVLLEMDDVADRCDALMPILQRHLETLVLVRRFEHIKPEEPRWN
jgi:Lon protease-like protein